MVDGGGPFLEFSGKDDLKLQTEVKNRGPRLQTKERGSLVGVEQSDDKRKIEMILRRSHSLVKNRRSSSNITKGMSSSLF